ncbi:putative trypsin-like peptidase domain-containing protein [Blattamonas nauphoetae]|uniref:Serine protease n=1 Tax=Blattamonas nauphoetae TaxID=2049346 RepID=A0ABQ9Y1N8_9EUKA|nr:putative trypsin-like peptidase domain-containing protein [Blattamonas nauphoetae]
MDHNSDNIILVSIPTSDSASVKFQFVSEDEKKALLGMNHFTTHSEDSPIDLPLQNDLSAPLDSYQDPHVEFIPMNAPHRPSRQLTNTGYKPPTLPFLKTINEPMIHENLSNSKPTPVESLFTMSGTTQSNTQRARQHGENSPTHVFGEDDRIPFYNSSYPWSAVGRVKSKKGVCTGTLVGKRLVVTGSHCVPWTKSGGADKITFTPGHNKNGSPFGSTTVSNILVYLKISGAMTNQQSAFDQAVLVLEDPLGEDAGFVGYTTFTKEWLGKKCWYNVGYPIDIEKSNVPVVSSEGSIEYLDEYTIGGWRSYLLGTFIDMTGGHSGGPIWGYFGDETFPRIVALISSESAKKGNDKHGDNNLSGGPALTHLIDHAKENYDS